MYLTHNEGKSVVAEIFVTTSRNETCKFMTSISQNMNIDKLEDIVNKYNNIYYRMINRKPVNIKLNTYILTLTKKTTREVLNLKLGIM